MGCVHATIDVQDPDIAGQNGDGVSVQTYNKRMNKVPNEVVQTSGNVDVASVTLKVLRETALDDDKGYAKSYRANTLGTFELSKSGSTLSLSDLETYRRKKFPKWKGYRRCKYCTHGDEFQSSLKSSSESVGSSVRETIINMEATDKKKAEKFKKEKTPRGLPSRDSCRNCSTKLTEMKNNARNNNVKAAQGRSTSRFVNLLAMNALDLTAPASDALLKNRKNAWVQLAGHPGSFAPAGPDTIWKKRLMKDNSEVKAYQALMNDAARDLVPTFYREVEYHGDFFIEMEDLLRHFHDPHIMDIKMGCRTFLEAEVKNPVLRKDLYEKMIRLDACAPTEEEHEQRAITKLRYMQFREQESSTASLGFRIEAIRVSGQTPVTDLKKVKTSEEVAVIMGKFISGKEKVRRSLHKRLVELRDSFEKSDFFKSHELIGSSLLIMFDNRSKAGVWMIDFAKTLAVEEGLTHRIPWSLGNHEDGYLTGMENLIQIFESLDFSQREQSELSTDLEQEETNNDAT